MVELRRVFSVLAAALLVAPLACDDQVIARPPPPSGAVVDAPDGAAGTPAPIDASRPEDGAPPAPACTRRFGDALTAEYGRLDGTVRAVTGLDDPHCPSDDNHVYVQIDVDGATYLASINVESTLQPNDPQVRFRELRAPLAFGEWSEGWHPALGWLDYPDTLGAHSNGPFEPLSKDELAGRIQDLVPIGAQVSVYFDGFRGGDGGHRVHRNNNGGDGALVVLEPNGLPRYLLFHFARQSF
jgi:hypothetical protein